MVNDKGNFTVRSCETEEDVRNVADFLQGIFGHGRDYILTHPDVKRPQSMRYVEHQGAIVSAHVLEHMELSVGENWVRAARVELVGTAPSFRMNGLCRLLMDDSMALLKTGGTQLVIIFGEPLFGQLGFEYCVPTYMQTMPNYSPPGSAIIPTPALAELKSSQWLRPMSPNDLLRIAEIHGGDNPSGNFSRRRPQYYWRHLVKKLGIDTYHVVGHGSKITGYVRIDSGRGFVQAKEVVTLDEGACDSILCHLYQLAIANGAEAVVFHCPHSGTFGIHIRRRGAAHYAPYAERETNLQMRLLDLRACLRMMCPTLSHRVQQSEFHNLNRRYNLLTESASAGLHIQSGKVSLVETTDDAQDIWISEKRMAQLLTGFRFDEAFHDRLVDVLFPTGEPYWYVDDIPGE